LRLFVLLSRFPYPLERGDKLRAFHQLRILSRHHTICLCALHEEELEEAWLAQVRPFCHELHTIKLSRAAQALQLAKAMFSSTPFQVAYFFQPSANEAVQALMSRFNPDIIYCQLLRTAEYVRHVQHIPKVIDFQDVFSKGMERRLHTDPFYLRPLLRAETTRLMRYEQEVFHCFDGSTIISEQDREQLPFDQKMQVRIVRNGVQMEVYAPSDSVRTEDVLFAGNMGYPPNVEACVMLGEEVMPQLWRTLPHARLMLAGARPTLQVRQLAQQRITVTGWVDDMRDCYAKAKVFVAPMRIGTGLQNKLLEAMAMRLPCITTSLANNALQAEPGKEIIIAETSTQFATAIQDLLLHPEKAEVLAANGHQFIKQRFGWEAQTEPLVQLLEEVRR